MNARSDARAPLAVESLEPRILLAAVPSAYDQYLLELVNRARANPVAEAARYGISLNEGIPQDQLISPYDVRQPLAFETVLVQAAQSHSLWMLRQDVFSHVGDGGSTPPERMATAGYPFSEPSGSGENIVWQGVTAPATVDLLTATAELHRMLFVDAGIEGRGHRLNLLEPDFCQIGIGVLAGRFGAFDGAMGTQDFAYQAGNPFITGVVYNDSLVTADSFYTPGEGLGKVTVTAQSGANVYTTVTWDSGGYSLQVPDGLYSVTFSGGALGHAYTFANVLVSGYNVKQDFLANNAPTGIDLAVLATPAGARTVYARPGADVTLSFTVRNNGTEATPDPFTVSVYRSADQAVTTADTEVATHDVARLTARGTNTHAFTFAAPAVAGTYYLAALADSGLAVAESAEENNWGSTLTLIVGEPDLRGAFTALTLPTTAVPGDRATVRVAVANIGQIPATGAVTVKVYASADGEPDGGDVLLLTLGGTNATWTPGQTRTFSGLVTVTDEIALGTYSILAVVDSGGAVAESDEDNNLVVSDGTYDVKWQFGTFDGRRNVRLSVRDAAGALVVFSLTGGGWGEVLGGADFTETVLHDTLTASSFRVTTRARQTVLGDITVLGHIGSIHAKAKLTGDVDVAGGLRSLVIGDVDPAEQCTVAIHTDGGLEVDPSLRASLSFGAAHDLSVVSTGVPIRSLVVIGWEDLGGDDDVLQAPAVDKLTVRSRRASPLAGIDASGGHMQADLDVAGAMRSAYVAGNVGGQWALGSLGSLRVLGDVDGLQLTLSQGVDPARPRQLTLGSVNVTGWIKDTRISSAGHVGSITAGGLWNADVFAGVDPLPLAGLPDPATDLTADVLLRSVTVRGTVRTDEGYSTLNVNLAAHSLLSVSLLYALADNDPASEWGLACHTLGRYSYRDATVRYTWTPRSLDPAPTQPGGDFTVVQA